MDTLKKKLIRWLTVVLAVFWTAMLAAQPSNIVASGTLLDPEGGPVVGAAVYQADKQTTGTFTDENGHFSLSVPRDAELIASFFGFEEVRFKAAQNVRITMEESSNMLEETVVVGYGVQRKESVVGAISQIKTEDVVNSGLSNVTQAIAGKLSGVMTLQSSGQPGSDNASIYIRGVSSWNGSGPLVMVDGVERSFNTIDPNEIATISVLKDASATAVFGAKGANGVILVTTRGGQKGKAKFNASVSHSLKIPTRLPKHIDAYTTLSGYNVAMKNSQSWAQIVSDYELNEYRSPSSELNRIRYPDIDWYDLLMKKMAHSTNANLNVSGGTDRTRYFVSLGYNHDGDIFKKQKFNSTKYEYQRLNYRANLDFDITESTTLTYRVGGSIGIQTAPGSSPITSLFSASTVAYPAYYPSWVLEVIPDWDYPNASADRMVTTSLSNYGTYFGSPFNKLNIPTYEQNTTSVLFTDLILNQRFDKWVRGLSAQGKFSFSTTMARVSESVSKSTPTFYLDWNLADSGASNPWISSITGTNVVEDPPYAATQGSVSSHSYNMYWEASLNYDRSWNNHHVTALALINQRENRSNFSFPYRSMGLVGRTTYDFRHTYLFEANLGYTGSEQFSPSNRFGIFPSVAVGYVPSNEKWWKKAIPWWSKLKLRYSDGYVGSDSADSRWLYYSSYSKSGGYIYEDEAANEVAQWEMAHKQDIGIEMGWLKDRLTAELDLFQEHRTHMLVDPVVPYLVGATYKQVNTGAMKKHGLEFEIKWQDRLSNGIGYYVKSMFSLNENRVTKYEDPPYLPDYQKVAGKPYQGKPEGESVVDGGYFTSVDDIHNYPSYSTDWSYVPVGAYKYLDYCVDGILNVNDLHSVKGSRYPSTLMSLGFGLDWKGWEFSALFYGNYGKYAIYDAVYELDWEKAEVRMSESMSDYWTPTHTNVNHATLVSFGSPMYYWAGYTGSQTSWGLVGRTWRNVDYLSLRDVYLGYTFNKKKIKSRLGINSLTLYMNGNNLFYLSNLTSGNPEQTSFTRGAYPLMSTVLFGLKVGF